MVPFLLNSKIFLTLLSVSIVDFEQVNACSSERALAHTIDRDFANFFSNVLFNEAIRAFSSK